MARRYLRDARGRFRGSGSARAGEIAGRGRRLNTEAGGSVLRNIGSVAKSTGTSIRGLGVSMSPSGVTSVRGRSVGRAAAKAVISRRAGDARRKGLQAFRSQPKSEQRRASKSQKRYLGL